MFDVCKCLKKILSYVSKAGNFDHGMIKREEKDEM